MNIFILMTPHNKIKLTHWIKRAHECFSKKQKQTFFLKSFQQMNEQQRHNMEKQKQIMNAVAENYVTGNTSIFFTWTQLLYRPRLWVWDVILGNCVHTYRKLFNRSTCFYLIFKFWSVLLFKNYKIFCSKNSVKSLFCMLLFKTCLYLN